MQRTGNHSVYDMQYHIVIVTKSRKPCINEQIQERLKKECPRLISMFGGSVTEIETDVDHVHILAELGPRYSVSDVMASLKGVTSRLIKRDYKDYLKGYFYGEDYSFWSDSYYVATTGGTTIEKIKQYIQEQGTPKHKRKYVKSGKYKKTK